MKGQKKLKQKKKRIYNRIAIIFIFFIMWIFTPSIYAKPVVHDFKEIQVKLYAGLTSEDWESYEIEIIEEEPEEIEEAPAINEEDLENLAKLIYAEGGGQGRECMLYVGSVILNRMTNGESWQNGSTVEEVWSRKGQYPGTYKRRNEIEPSEEAYEVARYLLENGSVLPSYVLYQHYKVPVKDTKVYTESNGEVFSY